ncbi:MAG TPA: TonB-dependent receptor [Gemmatimonadaceae bacterium]|nr:TonB-dependent receptor [Gemmatimonadaceae bacterium]
MFALNVRRLLTGIAVTLFALPAAAQNGTITGRVTDAGTGAGIASAGVRVLAGIRNAGGAATDENGNYRISDVAPGTYTVEARRVGYTPTRREGITVGAGASATVDIAMAELPTQLETIITGVSRAPEKVIDAPASVSVVNSAEINERPAITVADHVAALPGVDVARGGLLRSNIVARGFNNIFSGAMMTMTDNRFAFVPSLRVNIPYLNPTNMEDIDRIEVVLGPGAALYGPNTTSGVMAIFTKSPFSTQGTTVTVDGGNQSVLRGSIRTAWAPTPKFGFKVAYEAFRGKEWPFLAADTIGERKPRDRDINRQGGEIRADFRPTPSSEIIANYGRSQAGSVVEPTGLGPAQVKDWVYQTYQLRGRFKQLFAQVFLNTSDAGETYLLQKVQPQTNCPDVSDDACIIDRSKQFVAQAQHGLNFGTRERLLYGFDYIHTMPKTEGTINGNNEDDDEIKEVGGYLHSVTQLSRMFEVTAAARVDKHSRLDDPVFSPRLALVFKPVENQNLRLIYNRAFSTPSTNNLFLDRIGLSNALLNVRAVGTPNTGFQFRRDCPAGLGGLCMKTFNSFGGSATADFVAANPFVTSVAAARAGTLVAGLTAAYAGFGIPGPTAAALAAGVGSYLGTLRPTAAQVGTTLIIPSVGPGSTAFPVSPDQLLDIDRPMPTIHNTIEAGYKGILANRLQISLDLWHENRQNFVGPLQIESPVVFMNPTALNGYLSASLTPFFQAALQGTGLPASLAAQLAGGTAANLSTGLPGSNPASTVPCALATPAACPIGVVNFDTPNARNDVVLAYRSYQKSINLLGSDFGGELLLDGGFSLQGTYSWVNKKLFSKTYLGTREDVSLNAPANKHSFAINFRDEVKGLSAQVRERHVDGFNTLAFVGGPVEPYTLLDANLSVRPSFVNGVVWSLNGTNLLNKKHREFTQGNFIGRLIMTRVQVTF